MKKEKKNRTNNWQHARTPILFFCKTNLNYIYLFNFRRERIFFKSCQWINFIFFLLFAGIRSWRIPATTCTMQKRAIGHSAEKSEIHWRQISAWLSAWLSISSFIGTISSKSVSWLSAMGSIAINRTATTTIIKHQHNTRSVIKTFTSYAIFCVTVSQPRAASFTKSGTCCSYIRMWTIWTILSTECGAGATKR